MCSMKVHLRPNGARNFSMAFHAVQLRGAWVLWNAMTVGEFPTCSGRRLSR